MSKGWESKAVEEQQAAAAEQTRRAADARASADELARRRRVQGLELQRERVLSERTANPHRRSALEAALTAIELELQTLGWSIKL